MLTKFLIQDKTIASLGKTEPTLPVHVFGETSRREFTDQCVTQEVESLDTDIIFQPKTSMTFHMLIPLVGG